MSLKKKISKGVVTIWVLFSAWLGYQWLNEKIDLWVFLLGVIVSGFGVLYIISKIEK